MSRLDISTHLVRLFFFALIAGFLWINLYGIAMLAVPIGISFILAFALSPGVDFLEGLGMPRFISVILVLVIVIFAGYLLVALVVPFIAAEFESLMERSDAFRKMALDFLENLRNTLADYLPGTFDFDLETLNLDHIVGLVFEPVKDASFRFLSVLPGFVTYLLITPIILFLFLLQGHHIFHSLIAFVPNRYFELALLLVHRIQEQIASYLKGISLQILILTSILSTGYYLIGLPYGPVLGILAATVNIIPYLGPIIGLTPVLIVSLMTPEVLPLALLVFAIAQLVDNVFTQPVVLARSVKIHPLIAIMALITFQSLLGVAGMIIAIPFTGILVATLRTMHKSLKAFGVI